MTHVEHLMVRWWQSGIEFEHGDCRLWGQIADWCHGAANALDTFPGKDPEDLRFLSELAAQRQRDLHARRIAA